MAGAVRTMRDPAWATGRVGANPKPQLFIILSKGEEMAGLIVCNYQHQPGCICARTAHEAWERVETLEIERKQLLLQIGEQQEMIRGLREAQKCASCGGSICPPMQCGLCIEKENPVPGMPARPATTTLREQLKESNRLLSEARVKTKCNCAEIPEEATVHLAFCPWQLKSIRDLHKTERPLGLTCPECHIASGSHLTECPTFRATFKRNHEIDAENYPVVPLDPAAKFGPIRVCSCQGFYKAGCPVHG